MSGNTRLNVQYYEVNKSSLWHSRPQTILYKFKLAENTFSRCYVAGIVKNILKLIQTFENNSHKPHGPQGATTALKHCRNTASGWFLLCLSKSSGFWLCPLILNSHPIRPCISLRRKFNNQQNAQHTFAVHYEYLHPALQLLVNFKLFSYYLTHMPNIRGLLLLDYIVLWTGMFPIKLHLKYLLV